MFSFLCKKELIVAASNVTLLCIELPRNASSLIRLFSTVKSDLSLKSPEKPCRASNVASKKVSFTCPEKSCRAANVAEPKKVSFRSRENSDLVLSLLRNHGLSDVHITKIVSKVPSILLACPEKIVLPKLQFFQSIGMPAPLLADVISRWPRLLGCSLEKQLIPFYECLKNLLQEDDKVFVVFKRSAGSFVRAALRNVPSNIAALRDYGVSKSNISFLVVQHPITLMMRSDVLVDLVNRVIEFGIDISRLIFVEAIRVLHGSGKSGWKRKKEVYGRWGWSESDIQMAFSISPICMALSEKKITSAMEFLVHEMNYEPKTMVRYPIILNYSLEKRIVPRCRVYKLLRLRGLIVRSYSLHSLILRREEEFLKSFVAKHEHLPHILDVYSGKLGLIDLGFTSRELSNFKPL